MDTETQRPDETDEAEAEMGTRSADPKGVAIKYLAIHKLDHAKARKYVAKMAKAMDNKNDRNGMLELPLVGTKGIRRNIILAMDFEGSPAVAVNMKTKQTQYL